MGLADNLSTKFTEVDSLLVTQRTGPYSNALTRVGWNVPLQTLDIMRRARDKPQQTFLRPQMIYQMMGFGKPRWASMRVIIA